MGAAALGAAVSEMQRYISGCSLTTSKSREPSMSAADDLPRGRDDALGRGCNVVLHWLGVGHRDGHGAHTLDGRLERAEALVGDDGGQAGGDAAVVVALVGNDDSAGFVHGRKDGRGVQR